MSIEKAPGETLSPEQLHTRIADGLRWIISSSADQSEPPEALNPAALSEEQRFHETCTIFGAIGAPEIKHLLIMILGREGASSPKEIFYSLKSAIAGQRAWLPQGPAVLAFYFTDALASAGLTEYHPDGDVALTPIGHMRAVPTASLLAGWSLKHEPSLASLLGSSTTKYERRAAETRINLILELITTPSSDVLSIPKVIGLSATTSDSALRRTLSEPGTRNWIRFEQAQRRNTGNYRVRHHDYDNRTRPFEQLKPLTKLAYEFVRTKPIGSEFIFEEAVDYIINRMSSVDPGFDAPLIRQRLHAILSDARSSLGVDRLSTYNNYDYTRISLQPDEALRAALIDLANIVLMIHDPAPYKDHLQDAVEEGKELLRDPESVAALLNKSWLFSNHNKMSRQKTERLLLKIIQEAGAISIDQVAEQYNEQSPRPLTRKTIAKHMQDLCATGWLARTPGRIRDSTEGKAMFYSINNTDQDKAQDEGE